MKPEAGRQFYQLVVVAWLTFSLGSVLLALLSWHQLTAQMEAGKQTVAIRDGLNTILKSLLDLETGERGYVITGNKQFLEPFNQAETNLPAEFNRLVALVHDDSVMLEIVTEFRAEAEASLSWQHDVISSREKNFDKAAALIATGSSLERISGSSVEEAVLSTVATNLPASLESLLTHTMSSAMICPTRSKRMALAFCTLETPSVSASVSGTVMAYRTGWKNFLSWR